MTPVEAQAFCVRLQQAVTSEQQAQAAAQAQLQEYTDAIQALASQAPSAATARRRTALRAQMHEAQARGAEIESRIRRLVDKKARIERALRQVGGVDTLPSPETPQPAVSEPLPAASEPQPAASVPQSVVADPQPAAPLPPQAAETAPDSTPVPAPAPQPNTWIHRLLGEQNGGFGGRIGPYRVERLLGSGSQATVFLAADAIRQVALKVIDAQLVDNATRAALRKEARRLAAIRHENVVQVFGYDEVSLGAEAGDAGHRVAYFSLEYMSGGTLGDLEKAEAGERRLLSPRRAVEACLAAARGLVAIHAAGFVHCDIKPNNILTDGGSLFRVGDLGVAAEIGWNPTSAAGTLAYLPPEVLKAHHERSATYPIAPACDIYSLGATLFRLLTGRAPVAALAKKLIVAEKRGPRSVEAWEAFAAFQELPDPRAWQADLPAAVSQVVLTATAFDPQARYASAEELVEALAEVHDQLRGASSDTGKRRRWLW